MTPERSPAEPPAQGVAVPFERELGYQIQRAKRLFITGQIDLARLEVLVDMALRGEECDDADVVGGAVWVQLGSGERTRVW